MPFVPQQQEKCVGCGRTVYAAERTVIEEKEQKKIFHKQCIRCTYERCNKVLGVGEYTQMESKFYCKPHFKQLFASKGNFDEGFGLEKKKGSDVVVNAPASFVPVEENAVKGASNEKKETSAATAAKIKSWREGADADICPVCSKAVMLAEKLICEEKSGKKIYHNSCFKCSQCGIKVDLRNYGSHDGKIFCKPHLKDALNEQNTGAARKSVVVTEKLNFIPEVKEEKQSSSKETPSHIAAKFKGLGGTEKCKACDKAVYATEKLILEELRKDGKVQVIYHKNCVKCCKCNIQLDATNYGTLAGLIYCKVHQKQAAMGEQAKSENAYFISPLRTQTDYTPVYDDANPSSQQESNSSPQEQPEEEQQQPQEDNSAEEERMREEEERRRQEEAEMERQRQEEEERRRQEEEEKAKQQQQDESTSAPAADEDPVERRRREREERKKRQEEEAAREKEETERRAEERRKRLEAIKNQ